MGREGILAGVFPCIYRGVSFGVYRGGVGAFGTCDCDGCVDDTVCWRKTTYAAAAPEIGSAFSIAALGAHWTREARRGVFVRFVARAPVSGEGCPASQPKRA